jgi:hypothetical protein
VEKEKHATENKVLCLTIDSLTNNNPNIIKLKT